MVAKGSPKKRTIAFFRLMVANANDDRSPTGVTEDEWEQGLINLSGKDVSDCRFEVAGERLIGRAMLVDGTQYALRLMSPRSDESWLAILRYQNEPGHEETEEFVAGNDRDLVETSVIVFVPGLNNVFGIIRGSLSAPTHASVALWLTQMFPPGADLRFVAEPCLSRKVQQKLDASGGVAKTTVRLGTQSAKSLKNAGLPNLGSFLKKVENTYGEMIVTVVLQVPPGKSKGHQAARDQLKSDTETLASLSTIKTLKANLVVDDDTARRREEVNFIEQRMTTQTVITTRDDDGNVIRDDSAVRQIVAHGTDAAVMEELRAADPQ